MCFEIQTDIECQMDLLRTQKTRQLTALYRQLKSSMNKNDRIEFITRLSDVLKKESPSIVLDAVSWHFLLHRKKNVSKSSGFLRIQLTELLDRERVFLVSDFNDSTLDALRKRENELFANYIGGEKLFDRIKGEKICDMFVALGIHSDSIFGQAFELS